MAGVNRVTVGNIMGKVASGSALLVCAYDSDEKFRANQLEGAIPLSEFKVRVVDLAKDRQIVFYCN